MKLAIVLGTRPEIIKTSPIIEILDSRKADYFVLHTGQHYSYEMDRIFFEQLRLPTPRYNLGVGSGTSAEETGRMLIGIEEILAKEEPTVVLVEGDTNTVLAGALAAAKLGIPVGHIEAGLRSFDRTMPEELNRIIADHVSDLLFAPTAVSRRNLLREGIGARTIFVTGNTIVDVLLKVRPLLTASRGGRQRTSEGRALCTLHRQENVDSPARLRNILDGLEAVHRKAGLEMSFPMHPRTRKRCSEYGIRVPEGIVTLPPMDYLSFLKMESESDLILTDSGGVQEEACVLRVPCVTLRLNTERPETVKVGANMVAGVDAKGIADCALQMVGRKRDWANPYGDGKAGARILEILDERGIL